MARTITGNLVRSLLLAALLISGLTKGTAARAQHAGDLVVSGDDGYGQVSTTPPGKFTSVAAGWGHFTAIRDDGTLASWGRDWVNVVSDTPSGTFQSVALGVYYTNLAVRTDGVILGWGADDYYILSTIPSGTFKSVAMTRTHAVAIRTDGTLASWGGDSYGAVSATPPGQFKAVAAGVFWSVGIRDDGTLAAWGLDNNKQITNLPAGTYTAVAALGGYGIALRSDGVPVTWGETDYSSDISKLPAPYNTGGYIGVAAGWGSTYGLFRDGTVIRFSDGTAATGSYAYGYGNLLNFVGITNAAPAANAGTDQSITVPHDGDPATSTADIALDGTGSSDPNGDTLAYEWKEGSTVLGTTAQLTVTKPAGSYTFTLTVTDLYGASSSDDVNVTVSPEPNSAPAAHAGDDQSYTVAPGGSMLFTLFGFSSSDPDGDPLTFEWSLNGSVVGTDPFLSQNMGNGTYTYTLKVTDPYGASSTDDVTVTIADTNRAPMANAGPDQHISSTVATSVTLDGSASSDPDGDSLTYSWAEGGTVIATGVKPTVSLLPGTHSIALTVSDPYGGTSADDVVVTVDPRIPTTSTIAPSGIVMKRGQTKSVNLHLKGGTKWLVGKTQTVYVDDAAVGMVSSANPAKFTYTAPTSLSIGTHSLTVRFAGDLEYQPSEFTGTLKIGR